MSLTLSVIIGIIIVGICIFLIGWFQRKNDLSLSLILMLLGATCCFGILAISKV